MLYIHNSATKKKQLFTPIIPGKISLYVCGITAYDYCHIGHGRVFVVFDIVTRYLRSRSFDVTYVRNITDIDDKIINRAAENGESIEALTERFIATAHEDERALGVLPPDIEPRATQHVPAIIAIIKTLLEKNYAYIATNGDVYYSISRFADYGKFSHQSLEKLRHGARVDILEDKQDPLDFVLWKLAKPGEPTWDSPWGKGRPGWHIECSAMSAECLGKTIDIHGGGLDLVFPHHQNEIAQSEAAFNCHFANTWMHMGYIQVHSEKMSKSLHNFSTIREVLAQYEAEIVRYFMLASHYRSPINYSPENLESAKAGLSRLYISLRGLPEAQIVGSDTDSFLTRFNEAMDDDFNTPLALSVLFDMARDINKLRDDNKIAPAAELGALLKKLCDVFGILQKDPEIFLQLGTDIDMQEVDRLIAARNAARANKAWAEADQVRQELLKIGVIVEDTAQGTVVRKA